MRRLSVLVLAVTAVTATAVTLVGPARASNPPGWRVWQVAGVTAPYSYNSGITALSKTDAWVVGGVTKNAKQAPRLTVKHWNGKSWSQSAVPSNAATTWGGQAAVAASSAANALVFNNAANGSAYGLRWNGKNWSVSPPHGAVLDNDAIFGSADAWAFGNDRGVSYATHYNGYAWKTVSVPVETTLQGTVSAVSASDIWAVGVSTATAITAAADQVPEAAYYNGKSWKAMPITNLHLPKNQLLDSPVILALSPKNVWVYSALQGFVAHAGWISLPGVVLTHWNGKTWSRVAVPYQTQQNGYISSDGHGGVWLSAATKTGQEYLYHDNAGKWTRTVVPTESGYQADVDALATIPGTTSVWAVGELQSISNNQDGRAVIWKYGA